MAITFNRTFTHDGRDYRAEIGRNDDGRRIIRVQMRPDADSPWRPVLEIDSDYWYETDTAFRPNG